MTGCVAAGPRRQHKMRMTLNRENLHHLHRPVMLAEVLENLAVKPEGIYVDATLGRGGHARAILHRLGPQGKLLALDRDPAAIAYARGDTELQDPRVVLKQGPFSMLQPMVKQLNWLHQIDGILLDLGVSSPQLDEAERGFSFSKEGPLDMRMDPTSGISAAEWINTAEEADIALVLKEYGEERFARRIAGAIVRARLQQPITTTTQLADIAAKANPRWEFRIHPATRTFQAVRIYINQELDELRSVLEQFLEILAPGGRFAVISFHSLEDRIVKRFIQKQIKGDDFPVDLPVQQTALQPKLRRVAGAIKASAAEIAANPRARSAILRAAEKIA